jgi:hypothetical protein
MRKVIDRRGGALVSVLFVSMTVLCGCGGRSSHPIEATNAYDSQLSCDHLRAERQVNDARIADLAGEKGGDANNNVGKVLEGPVGILFLDLSDSEKQEITAFQTRNKVLDQLIAQKCPPG